MDNHVDHVKQILYCLLKIACTSRERIASFMCQRFHSWDIFHELNSSEGLLVDKDKVTTIKIKDGCHAYHSKGITMIPRVCKLVQDVYLGL